MCTPTTTSTRFDIYIARLLCLCLTRYCIRFEYLQYPGRSLIFVNSIKAARRLDGLLRALGINCRTLHAQLQQKQRLMALESFSNLPVGVLGEFLH